LLERRSLAVDGHLDELPPGEGREPAAPGRDDEGVDQAPVDAAAPVDDAAALDDADVSALLLDEQPAESAAIGKKAVGKKAVGETGARPAESR
jgi:monovalent cation/hydrogen antiporter